MCSSCYNIRPTSLCSRFKSFFLSTTHLHITYSYISAFTLNTLGQARSHYLIIHPSSTCLPYPYNLTTPILYITYIMSRPTSSVPFVVDSRRAASSIHITVMKSALGGGGHEKDTGMLHPYSFFIPCFSSVTFYHWTLTN